MKRRRIGYDLSGSNKAPIKRAGAYGGKACFDFEAEFGLGTFCLSWVFFPLVLWLGHFFRGHGIGPLRPSAKIRKLAAFGTKRPKGVSFPVYLIFAHWTLRLHSSPSDSPSQ